MADDKPKYQFRRGLDDIKDIVHKIFGSDPKKIINFLEALTKFPPVETIFSQTDLSIGIGNNELLSSVNLQDFEDNLLNIGANRFYVYLFPSDLVRALTNLAIIFVKKDLTLSKYTSSEFGLIKKWGDYDSIGYRNIDEVSFKKHYKEIQQLLNDVINAYRANLNLLNENNKDGLSEEDLKKLAKDLEEKDEADQYLVDTEGGSSVDTDQEISSDEPADDPSQPEDFELGKQPSSAVVPSQVAEEARLRGIEAAQSNIDQSKSSESPTIGLTSKQRQKIQYEVAWMYNRAIYEMATAYGIDRSEIDPVLLQKLSTDIYKFTLNHDGNGLDPEDLALMFGSASKRQDALIKFYPQFIKKNRALMESFYQQSVNKPNFLKLSDKQQESFKKFHQNLIGGGQIKKIDPTEHLKNSLANILNSDSPVLNKNIQITVDSMIFQYGVNQELFISNQTGVVGMALSDNNKNDLLKIINAMSAEKLSIVFGIPLSKQFSKEDLIQLKKILKNYILERASELSLHIQDSALSKGLMNVTDDDLVELNKNNSETSIRHLDFTTSTRKAIEKNGAETVIGGMVEKKDSARKTKIKQEFKTFLPLWNGLNPSEQRIIYQEFGLAYNQNINKDTPLEFVPEFLFYDLNKLKTSRKNERFSKIEKNVYVLRHSKDKGDEIQKESQETQEEFLRRQIEREEINEIIKQLAKEEEYHRFLNFSYLYNTQPSQAILIANYLSNGAITNENYQPFFFDNYSNIEMMDADTFVQDTNYQMSGSQARSGSRIQGITNRFSNRIKGTNAYKSVSKRFRNFAGKKLDPRKKVQKALEQSAKKASVKAVNAALSSTGVGTVLAGLNTAASKIGYKRVAAILGGAATYVVAKTLSALSTVGGAIGGAVGGAAGFIFGGPLGSLMGIIGGANFGAMISSKGLTASIFGGGSAPLAGGAPLAYSSTAASNATLGTSAATPGAVSAGSAGATSASAGGAAATAAAAKPLFVATSFLAGLPITILAPGIAMFIAIGVSLYTVLVIQSAFLIPIPKDYFDTRIKDADLDDGFVLCWPTTGTITQLPNPEHLGKYKVGGITQAIDIGWNGVAYPPPVHASHNGVATVTDSGGIGYGLHVTITSNEGYVSIYGHLSAIAPGLTSGQLVGRGDLIGYMGNTGNSISTTGDTGIFAGTHLHYEFHPGLIANAVPNGNNLEIYQPVVESCSSGGNPQDFGYLAIGSISGGNVVASSSNEISSGSVLTCSWKNSKGLDAAINANFFNNSGGSNIPVGLAGYGAGDVKYWQDPTKTSLKDTLRSFVLSGSSPQMIDPVSNSGSGLNLAVTGIWSNSGSDPGTVANRTILGFGTPTPECAGTAVTVAGPALFIGVIPQATFQQAENMLKQCGASQLLHLDGGGSSAFCSDSANFNTTRVVPVSIGLKNAQVFQTQVQ